MTERARGAARTDGEPAGGTDDSSAAPASQRGPCLRRVQDHFAKGFSSGLSSLIGQEAEVHPAGWARRSYAEFLASLREPTSCAMLSAERRRKDHPIAADDRKGECLGRVWLEIAPQVAHAVIELLLGGAGEGACIPNRPLTSVEQRLLRRVAALAAEALTQTWPAEAKWTFQLQAACSARPAPPADKGNEPVTVLTFKLSAGPTSGLMRLCIPQSLLGQAVPPDPAPGGRSGPVGVSATLPDMTLSADELAGLAVGDILTTDEPADGEVIVRVAGIPKYRARVGSLNGRRAVTITRRITSEMKQDPSSPEPSA